MARASGDLDGTDPPPGRIDRARTRAEEAAKRYQELARRKPLYALPIVLASTYVARQGMLLASALAFRTFLWLMPLALLVASVLAGVGRSFPGITEMAAEATGVAATARRQVVAALDDGARSWWVAALIGLLALLWTTRTLMRNLVQVNAHVWDVKIRRQSQKWMVISTLVFVGAWFGVFLAAALVSVFDLLPGGVVFSFAMQVAVTSAAWLAISLRLPDRRGSWQDVVPGSVLLGLGLAVMHLVSRVYLPARLEHSAALYGSLGIAAVILVWLLAIGHLMVGSALVNRVWKDYRDDLRAQAVAPPAPPARPGPDRSADATR